MLNDLNWQLLQIRRKNKRLIVFHKAVNQNSPVEIPDYVTQSTYSWQSIPVFDSPRQEAVFVLFVVGSDFNESFGVRSCTTVC
jgi:hypothetical protein